MPLVLTALVLSGCNPSRVKGIVEDDLIKHNIEDKIKENVTVVYQTNDLTNEELATKIKNMSAEDKKEILNLLKDKKENNGSQKTE